MAKVDVSRVYAIYAIALWSHEGRPSCSDMEGRIRLMAEKNAMRREEQRTAPSKPTEAEVMAMEREQEKNRAKILDMMAAEKVYNILESKGRALSVEYVYMRDPMDVFKKGEIKRRVTELAMVLSFEKGLKRGGGSTETIWRDLRLARELFALERGISCGNYEKFFQK